MHQVADPMEKIEYQKHVACLISNAADLSPLKGYEKHFLVKSKASGFVFCDRIPTLKELEAHYSDYPRVTELSSLTKKRYHELLDRFEEYRSTNKLLDVGCGNGLFLQEARNRGWEVYGTEFSDDAVSFCKQHGIEMKQGPLKVSDYELGSFDVLTSFEVLEHINNPRAESSAFHSLLRKGGLLYVTTPNFNCLERYVNGADYDLIEYPEHLCYYTKKTMDMLFKSAGFRAVQTEAVNIDISKLFRKQKEIGQQIAKQDMRESLESRPFLRMLKALVNRSLNLFALGNALKGWYIKT